jgi:hypothetical protein
MRWSALRADHDLLLINTLVLTSVWVENPRAIVRLEGLGQLKSPSDLFGNRISNLPVSSIVPQPTTLRVRSWWNECATVNNIILWRVWSLVRTKGTRFCGYRIQSWLTRFRSNETTLHFSQRLSDLFGIGQGTTWGLGQSRSIEVQKVFRESTEAAVGCQPKVSFELWATWDPGVPEKAVVIERSSRPRSPARVASPTVWLDQEEGLV